MVYRDGMMITSSIHNSVSGRWAVSHSTTQKHYLCTIVYWRIHERRGGISKEDIQTYPLSADTARDDVPYALDLKELDPTVCDRSESIGCTCCSVYLNNTMGKGYTLWWLDTYVRRLSQLSSEVHLAKIVFIFE